MNILSEGLATLSGLVFTVIENSSNFILIFKDDAFYCVDIGDILIKHYKVL